MLEGLGKGTPSLAISLARYVVVMIPVAFILSRMMGADGVWTAFCITEAMTAAFAYLILSKRSEKDFTGVKNSSKNTLQIREQDI